jgi:hypothetical protein
MITANQVQSALAGLRELVAVIENSDDSESRARLFDACYAIVDLLETRVDAELDRLANLDG